MLRERLILLSVLGAAAGCGGGGSLPSPAATVPAATPSAVAPISPADVKPPHGPAAAGTVQQAETVAAPAPPAPAPAAPPADTTTPAAAAAPAPAPAPAPADTQKAAPAAPAPEAAAPAEPPLFQRLGGQAAIAMVVDTFTDRVHSDTALAPLFRGTDMDHFKKVMNELLCQLTGGGCAYSGRTMLAAHTGLGITDAQFDTVVGYLSATLDQFSVPAREKTELLGLLAPMRGDIVGH